MHKLLVLVTAVLTFTAAQDPGAARVLTGMRQAIGGDAALGNVKTLSLRGTLKTDVGERTIEFEVQMQCELPDKCVRSRTQLGGPFRTTVSEGFNGDDPIYEVDARLPPPPSLPTDNSADAVARRRAAQALYNKEEFVRLLVALFGAPAPALPLQFTYGGPDTLDGRNVEALEMTGGKDFSGRLLVDAETHLPAALIWKTAPLIVMSTSQTIATRRGEVRELSQPAIDNPRRLPPGAIGVTGPPTPDMMASLPRIERRRIFSGFKTVDGLTWPRRITDFADGQLADELTLDSIKINPKLDPKRFTPSR